MFNNLLFRHLNQKSIQILAIILLFPLFVGAQTAEDRAKIVSGYDQKAIAELKVKQQKAQSERNARIALYLQQNKVERTFSKGEVQYSIYDVDANGQPIYIHTKNVESGEVIKANTLHSGGSLGLNIQGQGMIVGVWDGGAVRATHELLAGQATVQDPTSTMVSTEGGRNHMAHVTGTMVGKHLPAGTTEAQSARGIAFNATARCYDWDDDIAEMTTFGNAGYLISNHSYGYPNKNTEPAGRLGAYNSQTREWDMTLKAFLNYLPFVAGGNEQTSSANAVTKMGYDVISGSSGSKNVMTVGALDDATTMSNYSNWGPTDDGRFKPDIMAKGTQITSSYSTSDNIYNTGNGTSYATPATAALATLLQQYHNSVKSAYLDAAGLKALMLHTATDLGQPGPDYKFGWGLANGEKAAQTIAASNSNLATNNTTTKIAKITTNPALGASVTYTLKAKGGSTPLSASICWTDDEGNEQLETDVDNPAARLVYNFDIKLVDQVTMTEYFPWKGPGMVNRTQNSTRAGVNDVDNYKRVDIDAPVAGRNYQLIITKRATSPATDRQFAIVWTGLEGAVVPVELVELKAKAQNRQTLLTWRTASEKNNLGFDIEKSVDGQTYEKIGFVKGVGTTQAQQTYSFTDSKLNQLSYYRLRQVDFDGTAAYSNVVSADYEASNSKVKIYPNPTSNSQITMDFAANTEGVSVFNTLGQIVFQQKLSGLNQLKLDISSWAKGVYFIKTSADSEAIKFVKQ